jgi:hypothetical protein
MDSPNPKRVAAGKRNWLKRRGLSAEGAEKLRQSAHAHQPWQYSTGPRTPAGKAQARRNGKVRQQGTRSVREVRQLLAQVQALATQMAASRRLAQQG